MQSMINSDDYWDKRFNENWELRDGPRQSRFFAQLALDNVPSWLIKQIQVESLTVADWGCAQGDGTNVWASYINSQQLSGVDFSQIAIDQAHERYPSIQFICENWLESDDLTTQRYDVVFSSNTLEHFHNPFDVLKVLAEKANNAIVLALPYRELNRIDEHFYTFLAENIPIKLANGFHLVWSKVIDCTHIPSTQWSGHQIILIYANMSWTSLLQLKLSDCLLEDIDINTKFQLLNQDIIKKDTKIFSLNQILSDRVELISDFTESIAELTKKLSEKDVQISSLTQNLMNKDIQVTDLDIQLNQMYNQIQMMQQSKSWRWTKPLRLLYKLLRNLLTVDGRYYLLKKCFWMLPQTVQAKLNRYRYKFTAKHIQKNLNQTNTLNNSAACSPVDIVWVDRANLSGRVVVIPCGFEFDELVNQRPINAAKYFSERGYFVLFIAWQWSDKEELLKGCGEVYPNVFQVPLFDFIRYENKLDCKTEKSFYFITMPSTNLVNPVPSLRQKGFTILYDIMDDWEEFYKVGQAPWFDKTIEENIILQADVVSAVSSTLQEKFNYLRSDIKVIGNGFTPKILGLDNKGIAINKNKDEPCVIGYFGHLTDAWFDWKLVFKLAKKYPHIIFEIIGYGEPEWVRKESLNLNNVNLIGKMLPENLYKQVRNWSIGIIPFIEGTLSKAVDPIKIYEYLYFGLPTIVTGIPHLKNYPMTYLADENNIVDIVECLINKQSQQEDINEFLNQTTWQARFDSLVNELSKDSYIRDLYEN